MGEEDKPEGSECFLGGTAGFIPTFVLTSLSLTTWLSMGTEVVEISFGGKGGGDGEGSSELESFLKSSLS